MSAERRASVRKAVELPPGLRLTVPAKGGSSRTVMSKLLDVSDGGIGIETFVRIPSGVVIEIRGDWRAPEMAMRIHGRAQVAHVSEVEAGRYKIGLQFVEIALARSA